MSKRHSDPDPFIEFPQVPRIHWNNPDVAGFMERGEPCVLTGKCQLASAPHWTIDKLEQLIDPNYSVDAYESDRNIYQFFTGVNEWGYNVNTTMNCHKIKMRDFMMNYRKHQQDPRKNSAWYLNQVVVAELGPRLKEDYMRHFSLDLAFMFQGLGKWDSLSTNLLIAAPAGAITTLHFDEQHNLFSQLTGRKRIRLFPPSEWSRLYVYPVGHPSDRQCQITLPRQPGSLELSPEDKIKFPAFEYICNRGESWVDLEPGEILYVPQHWFHQAESLTAGVSMSWWYKDNQKNPTAKVAKGGVDPKTGEAILKPSKSSPAGIDLSKVCMTAVRRNVEKLMAQALKADRTHLFFRSLAAGIIAVPGIIFIEPGVDGKVVNEKGMQSYHLIPNDVVGRPELTEADMREFEQVVQMGIQLISAIIPRRKAPMFLLELVEGRYANLEAQQRLVGTKLQI